MNLFKLLHLLLTFQSLIPRSETQLNDAIGRGLAKFVSAEPLANRTGKSLFKLFVQRCIGLQQYNMPPCVFMDSLFIKKPLYRIAARVSHNVNHLCSLTNIQSKEKHSLKTDCLFRLSVFKFHIKEKINGGLPPTNPFRICYQ